MSFRPLPNDYKLRPGEAEPDDDGDTDTPTGPDDDGEPDYEVDGNLVTIKKKPQADEPGNGEFYDNLAKHMSPEDKTALVEKLLKRIEIDKKSRAKRDEQQAEGIRRTGFGDDAPGGAQFQGASRVVHPVMGESCVDFSAAEMRELFPPDGPVKTKIVGKVTPEKMARADRKAMHMNLQITQEMPEYRAEMEVLTTQLPMGGSQYMKPYYDEDLGRPTVEFVPIDDVWVPFSSKYFYNSERITHRQRLTQDEVQERIDSDMYLDFDMEPAPNDLEQTKSKEATDKAEGAEPDDENEDGLRDIYETSCMWKLESKYDRHAKGKRAPYLITIDEDTEELLAIYRNWEQSGRLADRIDFLIDFQFLPWRGGVGIGLPQLIGMLAGAATGALRALLDSALLANMPTLVKAKGRPGGQSDNVSATQITEIDVPSGKSLQQSMQQMNFPGPSVVLYQLLGFLVTAAKGVVTTAEEKIADVSSTQPVGTTLALIEQGSKVASSIHARMHASQARLLCSIHRLNRLYLSDKAVLALYGEQIVRNADYQGPVDVIPVSDPTIFSETQRVAQSQMLAQRLTENPSVYIPEAVEKRLLERFRIPDIEDLLKPYYEAKNTDAVDENMAMSLGRPVMAYLDQDHLAHLTMHLSYFTDPRFGASPLVAPIAVQGVLGHCREHLAMWYRALAFKMLGQDCGADPNDDDLQKSTEEMQELDKALVLATHLIHGMKDQPDPNDPQSKSETPPEILDLPKSLQTLLQAAQLGMKMIAPIMQAATPPNPVAEATKAETARRAAEDQAQNALEEKKLAQKGQETQVETQLAGAEHERKVQKDAQDLQVAEGDTAQAAAGEELASATKRQVNQDDNQTALTIAGMKATTDLRTDISTGTGLGEGD